MRSVLKLAALVSSAAVLFGCATAPRVMSYFPTGAAPDEKIVWPGSAEVARIEFAGLLIGEQNFSQAEGSQDGAGIRLLRWIAGIGNRREEVRQLIRPQSGTVDANGRILITDAGRRAVLVFDEKAGKLSTWEDAGTGLGFASPVGIAVRSDGNILVADAELGYIIVLTPEGDPIGRIGEGDLLRPTGLAIDSRAGNIYASDTEAHDIKVFASNGSLSRTIGVRGTGRGEFNGPTHLQLRGDRLYVTDTFNARVQVLTVDGEQTTEVGERGLYVGNLIRPKGVTTDSDGNVYIIESYYDHLLVFDAAGRLLLPIGGTGNGIGQFFLPAGAWSDAGNRIFVADMFNGRVIVFRYLGG